MADIQQGTEHLQQQSVPAVFEIAKAPSQPFPNPVLDRVTNVNGQHTITIPVLLSEKDSIVKSLNKAETEFNVVANQFVTRLEENGSPKAAPLERVLSNFTEKLQAVKKANDPDVAINSEKNTKLIAYKNLTTMLKTVTDSFSERNNVETGTVSYRQEGSSMVLINHNRNEEKLADISKSVRNAVKKLDTMRRPKTTEVALI